MFQRLYVSSVTLLLLLITLVQAGRSGTNLPTACLVNLTTAGSSTSHGLTPQQKVSILDLHNQYRYDISNKAQSMPLLVWDEKLSESASRALGSIPTAGDSGGVVCPRDFSPWQEKDRANLDGYSMVGQNVLTFDKDFSIPNYPVKFWGSLGNAYTYAACTSDTQELCGSCGRGKSLADCMSYTQVVWASTTHVGCAVKTCGSRAYFTCLYGPAGNRQGQTPYVEAKGSGGSGTNGGNTDSRTCQNPQTAAPASPEGEASWKKPLMYAGGFVGLVVAGSFFYVMTNDDCSCCDGGDDDDRKKRRQSVKTRQEMDETAKSAYVLMNEQSASISKSGVFSPAADGETPVRQLSSSSSGNTSINTRSAALAAPVVLTHNPLDQQLNNRTRERLVAFFTKYNQPQNIGNIDQIMEKFKGKEDRMWRALEQKYGPEEEARGPGSLMGV